ncbi:Protein root UVB sensitive [Arachis hypogaea]|nr:Protein root UVB sensitive [Arachis hypogaea]
MGQVKELLKLYANEKHILIVNQHEEGLEFYVSFKVGAMSISVLRSVWQMFWLSENWDGEVSVCDQLANSLMQLEDRFDDFIQKLKEAGWDAQKINLKVPTEVSIDDINLL